MSMADTSAITSALAPGVALTSAVIYWANLQSRLDTIAGRVRSLNSELRGETRGSRRAESVQRQIQLLFRRSQVLHTGVVLSIIALVGFLGSSAMLFIAVGPVHVGNTPATALFMMGLGGFGASLFSSLWEMLWARRSLEEDVRGSVPQDSLDVSLDEQRAVR
ncbi:MAG: DUF2721 domain-containing protein [Myxococcales bacterium]